jgi:hypothetical protein
MPAQIMREEWRHESLECRGRCADSEDAGLAGLQRAGALAQGVGFGEHAASAAQQVLSLQRQLRASAHAVKQLHAELGFQRVHLP